MSKSRAGRDRTIEPDDPTDRNARGFVDSHFGSGVLTFSPLVILRTQPGDEIFLSGPPNE